jgi:hypothetical protein
VGKRWNVYRSLPEAAGDCCTHVMPRAVDSLQVIGVVVALVFQRVACFRVLRRQVEEILVFQGYHALGRVYPALRELCFRDRATS